jgi:hypothetical protein
MAQDMHAADAEPSHDTPLRAVRRHCLDCAGNNANEVRHCPATSCRLWPHRFGKRPSLQDKAAVAGRRSIHWSAA